MENKRKAVLEAVKAKMLAIDALRAVKLGTFEPNHEHKPCLGIIWDRDRESRSSKLHAVVDLYVTLRLVVDETHQEAGLELLEIAHLIEEKMREDPRLSGLLTDDAQKDESGSLYLDERWPQAGADIDYIFHYQVS